MLFASEIKAILAVAPQSAALDVHGLAQIFTFWATVGSRTAFEGISSLPPGHLLIVENGTERLERYWDWTFPARGEGANLSIETAAEALRSLLSDAVRLQLRADVRVGAYLSGGLDSSGIAALARQTAGELQTFSITFDEAEYDEGRFQRQMAEHLGVKHAALRCTARDIGEAFPDLIWHTESPILRTAPAPLML
ncbi:asparagine synthase (glutamine-hydrolyzing), partial [mine drainage metagenome]